MAIVFVLKETLDKRDITRNKLSVEGKLRLATIHEMCNNQSKQIKLETLDTIIKTITSLSNQETSVSDIIKFVDDGVDEK